ncbi:MAG: LPS assembly lipoprotein LptE [Caulobacteraceae bacterium]
MTRLNTPFAKLAALALAAGGALALSACGFAPLYGAPGVVSGLAAIHVTAPEGRAGELIREHLDDALAHSSDARPAYQMTLKLYEQRFPRGVRVDNVATRYEYVLTAVYTLTPTEGSAKPKTGRVRVEVTYDSADQPYASIAAQQDAEDRAAEEAARRIQLELAAWLATGEPSAAKAQKVTPPPANSVTPSGLPSGT